MSLTSFSIIEVRKSGYGLLEIVAHHGHHNSGDDIIVFYRQKRFQQLPCGILMLAAGKHAVSAVSA